MDKSVELELFKLNYRSFVLERLVLRLYFVTLATRQGKSSAENRTALREMLRQETSLADKIFGNQIRDPALTALYADEAKEVIDSMISMLESFPDIT